MANTMRRDYIPGMIDCDRAILDSVLVKNFTFFPLYRKQMEKKEEKTGDKGATERRKFPLKQLLWPKNKGSDCKEKKNTHITQYYSLPLPSSPPPPSPGVGGWGPMPSSPCTIAWASARRPRTPPASSVTPSSR